ncbi:DUF5955 family protein [Streptomyces sp. NPDC059853]|uniref:DUF5955 family protein n=1 Tax=Streptomyces sp. NPDC059853 TaxID=3346973 RepID=UPI003649D567
MVAGEAEVARVSASAVADEGDPRLAALRTAVERLRADLSGYQAWLADRQVAERELTVLAEQLAGGVPEATLLSEVLLRIAAAVGSVSALAPALGQLREAVELFGVPRHRVLPSVRHGAS